MKILGPTNQFQGIAGKSLQHNGASNQQRSFSHLIKNQAAKNHWTLEESQCPSRTLTLFLHTQDHTVGTK